MGLKKEMGKKSGVSIDVMVVTIVLILAGILYYNYSQFAKSATLDPNYIKGAPDVNSILLKRIHSTPLNPKFVTIKPANLLITFGYKAANVLTQVPFIDNIYHFVNKNQGFVHECSSDTGFVDSTIPMIRYPIDLTKKELLQKIKDYPELMIVDVRDEDKYIKGHIPNSVTMPLLVLVDQIYNSNRWTEIVVVGDAYLQTKVASEALLRLNFQRVHRLIIPVSKWSKNLESFQ